MVKEHKASSTPKLGISPAKRNKDRKLKTADLGVCLDQPLGMKAHKEKAGLLTISEQESEEKLFRNKAFAPNQIAKTLSKIQSLENFFKNESLSSSNQQLLNEKVSEIENRPSTVQSYAPIKTKNIVSMPNSPQQYEEGMGQERINNELNYYARRTTPSLGVRFHKQGVYSHTNSPSENFYL